MEPAALPSFDLSVATHAGLFPPECRERAIRACGAFFHLARDLVSRNGEEVDPRPLVICLVRDCARTLLNPLSPRERAGVWLALKEHICYRFMASGRAEDLVQSALEQRPQDVERLYEKFLLFDLVFEHGLEELWFRYEN